MSTHTTRVLDVATAVAARAKSNRGFASLKKHAVSHLVPNPRDPRHDDVKIDVSRLSNILSVDVAARRCVAEPGVTFADLVRTTLPLGLLPCMVPELETITLGGAVAGCAVESMAYKHGGFHDSCIEYEIVTGTGDIVRCSRRHDTELFEMMHGSYGTLGILTELTFDLVPAKPFVRMEYVTLRSFRELRAAARDAMSARDIDFIDVIAHARDCFVLCLGRFADTADTTSSYRGTEIFWRSTRERREDTLGTYDYLFRYDTDCHWTTRTLPAMNTRWGRRLFGHFFLGSTNLLAWTERLRPFFRLQKHPPVVTDLFIPETEVDAFYDWYEERIGYYPLWIVPYRMPAPYPWLRRERVPCELYFDFAIYGLPNDRGTSQTPKVDGSAAGGTPQTAKVDYSALLEQRTFEASGIKTLIGQNHYDERTFWSIYDRVRYERFKRRMDPSNLFRTVYEKLVRPHLAEPRALAAAPLLALPPHAKP